MIIREYDLFKGFDNEIIEEMMSAISSHSFKAGEVMFKQGDPADGFYVLDSGTVDIVVSGAPYATYTARNIGEVVGWSSMAGRDNYSAGAICKEETRVSKFNKQKLDQILRKHPAVGLMFYRRLCQAVGARLIECHQALVKLKSAS